MKSDELDVTLLVLALRKSNREALERNFISLVHSEFWKREKRNIPL